MFLSSFPILYVADVGRSTAFYCDLLGFTKTYQFPREGEPEHVEVRLGETTLGLTIHRSATDLGLPEPTAGHPFELGIWAEDTDKAIETLRAAGVTILMEPSDHAAKHRRAYMTDPDGNWISIGSAQH